MKMKSIKPKKISLLVGFCAIVLISSSSWTVISVVYGAPATETSVTAQPYTLLAPLPCIPTEGLECPGGKEIEIIKKVDFRTYVQYAMNLLIALAAVAAVVEIVYGGILYMTSSSFTIKEDGIGRMKNAIYGLLLVLCSYIILRTIDPRLVRIPNSLVKPIELKGDLTKNTSLSFMDQLQKEANEYRANTQEFGSKAVEARNKVSELQKELDDLNRQYYLAFEAGDIQTQNQLKGKMANVQNQLTDTQADLAVNLQQVITRNAVSRTTQETKNEVTPLGMEPAVVETIIINSAQAFKEIDETTKRRVDQLNKLGASDQVIAVTEQANISKAEIYINQQYALAYKYASTYSTDPKEKKYIPEIVNDSVKRIDATVTNMSVGIIDPAKKKALQDKADAVKAKILQIPNMQWDYQKGMLVPKP